MMSTRWLSLACALALASTPVAGAEHVATFAEEAPTIDGIPDDHAWDSARWYAIDVSLLGTPPPAEDFTARYKVVWDTGYLYLLAEIVDDVLVDAHPNPHHDYWNDDTLEIFVDEDASGGVHHFDHSAFAYHIGLDNRAVDIGPFRSEAERARGQPIVVTLSSHLSSRWQRSAEPPYRIYWEVRLQLHRYTPQRLIPATLSAGKEIGFMVAYCDADDAGGRQHFMGDVDIEPVDGDRNRAYIDADVFGRLVLQRSASPTGSALPEVP